VQQEKKLKEQQQRMLQQQQLQGGELPQPQFMTKHEDPLIKAEIDKNIKEQKKLLEQDYARSIEDIDRNFELKKSEILRQNAQEIELEKQKWDQYKREEERKIRAELD
jgi:hypothetical protein